jgi:hypothetical protein
MGSFQDLLNSYRKNSFTPALDIDGRPIPGTSTGVPSQMPGAMGGGFDHGIAGNLSGIQKMPYRYGDQGQGGIQQMPYIDGQGQGGIQQMPYLHNIGNMAGVQQIIKQKGFNLLNPFTYGNMGKAIDKTRAGDENVEYSDSAAGAIGKAANEKNRLIQQMLQGY